MTPLPRWVFLTMVLGYVVCSTAHPKDDACVHVCRAQKRSQEKNAGVCDYGRYIFQSNGGHSAIKQQFRLCLTPCSGPGTPKGQLLYEGTKVCQPFRKFLIKLRQCSCNSLEDQDAESIVRWEDPFWADVVFEKYRKYDLSHEESYMIKDIVNEEDRYQGILSEQHPRLGSKGMMKLLLQDDKDNDKAQEVESATLNTDVDKQSVTTEDPNSSEEMPVDWEMWCMAQCDNGQGGSACNCDIIP